ncbi:helix-turn-helix domain-containing protein [Halobellus ordinarius]|uniref:helix-turn-helix domain-containing protein n=1 Tax=Halobellus ordinarius TaxID=3075120 RepID=UPI0028801E4F|nr:helix-turn-helix domain-containing protein [Halobellus sp. ZY16]
MSGIRAEIHIGSPADCPAARASSAAGGEASAVSKSVPRDAEEPITEEFTLSADAPAESVEASVDTDLREVFASGEKRVYRFERSQTRTCLCECIEQFDCPVQGIYSRDGELTVSFYAPDIDTLQSVVAQLDERWSNVAVHRLIRSNHDEGDQDLVLVDRGELTDRQREVLRTAHEMGYFEHPKRANAGEVAAELGIDPSTFTEHLAAAQGKLLSTILDT